MSNDEMQQIKRIEHDVYVSVKDHLESLIEALDRRTEQAARDARMAIEKAEASQERRLDLLNEFRAQAADEAKKYLTQSDYAGRHDTLVTRVSSIETQIARLYGGLMVVAFLGVANLIKLWFTSVGH